jgi:hypothetical protein
LEDTHQIIRMFGQRLYNPSAWDDPVAYTAESLRVHGEVYKAIRNRDPKAARRAMDFHMRRTRKNLLSRFDWLERHKETSTASPDENIDLVQNRVREIQKRDATQLSRELKLDPREEARTEKQNS